MRSVRKTLSQFVLLSLLVPAAGCGGSKSAGDPESQRRTAEMSELYDMFTTFTKKNQRPPKQITDLRQFQEIAPVAYQSLKSGQYVAVWGVAPGPDSTAVLIYEKDAPKQGGTVLLANGNVKTMSADELQGALKSKG